MKKAFKPMLVLFSVLMLLSGLVACASAKKVELDEITYFCLSETTGNGAYSQCFYEAELVGDTVNILIKMNGSNTGHTFTAQPEFMHKLTETANAYNVGSYDGFDKADKRVLDGDSFSLAIKTSGGQEVKASGYMKYPENFREAMTAITLPFDEIYYEAYPDPEKELEKYLKETLVPGKGQVQTNEISWPYVSAEHEGEKGYYIWGEPDLTDGGVKDCIITDITGDLREEMIVTYLSENDGVWQLSFELYEFTQENEVKIVGEGLLEEDLFLNDGLYYNTQLINHEGGRIIVHSSEKTFFDSEGYKEYRIKIFGADGEVILRADEMLTFSESERDSITVSDIEPFVKIAEQNSLNTSLEKWAEKPRDPVVQESGTKFSTALITSKIENFAEFNEALRSALVGTALDEYCVSGKISVMD